MTTIPPNIQSRPVARSFSAVGRDWLKTLWPASYKGVPFYVEWDEEQARRRIVEHEFPMRDDPFLEDLGEGVRRYRCDAYVASDAADADAAAVIAVAVTRGPGALVLPAHGPLLVRCTDARRNRTKDKHGYIALEMRFVREGAASALASVGSLANLVFVQAEATALTVAANFVAAVQLDGQADFVHEAASEGVQLAASALEVIRTSQPVDPEVSSPQRLAIQNLFDQSADLVETPTTLAETAASVVAITRALGDAMPAPAAVAAFEQIILDPMFDVVTTTTRYPTPSRRAASENLNAARQLMRLSAVIAYAEAVARAPLADRPSAITLRANATEYFEQQTDGLDASQIDLVHAIATLRDSVVTYLSRSIIDLAPVLRVEVNMQLPSLYWAYRLYADPTRATELTARNRIVHPSFFPTTFEALAR